MDNNEKVPSDIYFNVNHPASFCGKQQLIAAAKEKNIGKSFVEEWLKSQDTYNLFKPTKRKFALLPIIVDNIDDQWQSDLLDISWFSRYNQGVKFLLVAIDCLSRYAWVRALKDKSVKSVKQAFSDIFRQGRIPKKLQTDQGTEFVNSELKRYFNTIGVHHFTTTNEIIKINKRKKTPIKYIYKLVDQDGEPISSIFYPEEVNEVKEKELYKIEKVLKTRKNPTTKKQEYFVKWVGYPSKFNSWVQDLQNV